MPTFSHDSLEFNFEEAGQGTPFFFQHGLGGASDQPLGLCNPPPTGVRLICLDCRGHGETRPLGPETKLSLTQFADDLLALQDRLGLAQAVVGGISMGAAVALNFVLRYPERVTGLVLSRPAWLAGPMQRNADIFNKVAHLIRQFGPAQGREKFLHSDEYFEVRGE